jgi:hypothetical protein
VCARLFAALLVPSAVGAQETTTYTYDVHGRVVGWAYSGTVNNGFSGSTTFDPADNATRKAVTQQAPAARMVTVQDQSLRQASTTSASSAASSSSTASAPETNFSNAAKHEANEVTSRQRQPKK